MSSTGPGAGVDPTRARPRQVTIAGVMATVACVLLVVALFDAMAAVGSTETQQSVRDFLATGPGGGLGLGVDGVTGILRGLVLFSGALAAAGAILAVYCLRRHRGARVGLSVVAVLMLFTTTFVAGLLPFVVALAASMLWRREARDWFDGRESQPGARAGARSSSPDRPPPTMAAWAPPGTSTPGTSAPPGSTAAPGTSAPGAQAPPGTSAPGARAGRPYGASGTGPAGWPSPYVTGPGDAPPFGSPAFGTPSSWGAPQAGARRPGSVTAAAWITWISCAVTTLLLVLLVVLLLVERVQLVTELRRNPNIADAGYTTDQLVAALWVVAAIGIFWALAAGALAVLAFQGYRAGQIGLVVSAAMAGIIGIATLVVPVLALATVVLLLLGPSNRWFATRRTPGPPPNGPPGWPPGNAGPPDDSGRPPVW